MQPCRHFAVAVALLLCSIAAATAAGTGPFLVASDELVLTGAQEHDGALRIESYDRRNATCRGRAACAACNRHAADTGDEALRVCDARQDAADHKPHRQGDRRRHYGLGRAVNPRWEAVAR